MTSQQVLSIIAIAMVATAVLIVMALITMRRTRPHDGGHAGIEFGETIDTMAAMVTVGGGSLGPSASAMSVSPGPADSVSDDESADLDALFDEASDAAGGDGGDEAGDPPAPLLDSSTGLISPVEWRRIVGDEAIRLGRYHRPATVMLVELDGFERLTERLGEPAGTRLMVATAKTIRAQARAADRCARLGRGRFGVLLPETDDIMAINFVERVRAECDRWLEAGEIALRLAIGWTSIDPIAGATAAIIEAERRLDAERRQRTGSAA